MVCVFARVDGSEIGSPSVPVAASQLRSSRIPAWWGRCARTNNFAKCGDGSRGTSFTTSRRCSFPALCQIPTRHHHDDPSRSRCCLSCDDLSDSGIALVGCRQAIREGTLDYIDSWRRVPIRPCHVNYQKRREMNTFEDTAEEEVKVEWREAINKGSRDLRPVLQKLYYTRARVLSKTIQAFAEGFREGIDEVKQRDSDRQRTESN